MTLANLSWPFLLGGAAVLAGLLYALQQLRIRYTEIVVPTAMFWREAARDAPVRVFRRRFRHWLAYLLSLLICWLLWLGLAEPAADGPEDGQYHVLYLDGSAHMSAPGDLERAAERLRDDLKGLPEDRREVIWGGAWNLKLLNAGEEDLLFDRRLEGLEAEPSPSPIDEQLRLLALQGAFREHIKMLRQLGVAAREVRLPAELAGLDGLIIPGGESTTIGKLATAYGLIEPLRRFAKQKATWGTCAGMIFLAKDIGIDAQPILGAMDITVDRNAFGRQIDSFETALDIAGLDGGPFPAVFIRAPIVTALEPPAQALARLEDGRIVAARQGRLLATAFHPELTADLRLHAYFCAIVKGSLA